MNFRLSPNSIFPSYRKIQLPQGDYSSDIVRYGDFVQMHALCKYISELDGKPMIIDVGSHHGAYSTILGKIVQRLGGKVIAVEPNPDAFKVLMENVRLNDLENTVICEQVALSNKSGIINFDIKGSQSCISETQTGFTVESTTLEKLMEKYEIGIVNLLIIDVEGAELSVLHGFAWELSRPQKVFVELHPYAWKDFGYTPGDMQLFLKEHQYRCFDMYLHEHRVFEKEPYIGPCIFVPIKNPNSNFNC
jgi:FkbM family methyltransferase